MIAIAGSKGGSGKSTVTLGLAEAFARAATPAIAVDADRQLPNLHVMADLERRPTVADLDRTVDITDVAQPLPRESDVGIVPAVTSAQSFEFDGLGEHAVDGHQLLLDCPSGAGPDVVDPLGEAEGAIIVASNTGRSLEAAETTIEMARRLGVPIYGVVLNRCTAVPDAVSRWSGVPILGCVPEHPSPLLNDEVRAAFDRIVETLTTQSPSDRAPPEATGGTLPTGTVELDARLDGGLEPGSIVALVASPASQAEHLLYRASGVRGTLYLSTDRSRDAVRQAIESASSGGTPPTIRHVGGEDALESTRSLVDKLPDAANLIIDPVDALERRDRRAYAAFLDALRERILETDGLAILSCLDDPPANRAATLRAADAVFELETVSGGPGTDIEHYLSVPKYRAKAGFSETIRLTFDANARVGPIEPPTRFD
ncbi:DUF7125 family protein [Natrarchaeobaculum sulfurireducens]|uniref:CobQ/CobB/MinD/ParA nucleotide binding domain-containing protein n=1 Tax=Natrarchaeobaculum sulfurireducens TaxID=2044521 RepID=A0A346PG89_9EURY|nr:AAA family ATPase [Natrarchaeobaculum sulfurireducens]AXR78534.1 hypothetical protein AArc1_2218 [Natrarchaeobaculum sulfurireducens]AXR81414.1 hypothetical protein AArcMg_1399 [Natrarchaeobaculum sulfurireducens]